MKNLLKKLTVLLALLICCSSTLFACGDDEDDWNSDATYTIQYALDEGTKTITVKNGELYSMESIPIKTGYDFKGLFDASVGGTKFVDSSGLSLSAFTDKKNMVLYPQWEPKVYNIILDYQGAPVTDVRSIEVAYDSQLPELPLGLSIENKNFKGWFTETNRGGEQIADEYGVLPAKNIFNENTFTLPTQDNRVYLYAGFQGQMYNVTLYFDSGNTFEEVSIEYGTYAKDIVCETRIGGKAVYSWTKTEGSSTPFTGKITGETILYALEFAPVIDFNTNGGKQINPLVNKAGNEIELPTPERTNYVFNGWKDEGGNTVNYTTMPTNSVTLTAQWKPTITFDSRGGTEVSYIAQETGSAVTLPSPTKSGFIFAGWYTQTSEKYTSTSMPQASIKLYAKWYKIVECKYSIVDDSGSWDVGYKSSPSMSNSSYAVGYQVLDLTELYSKGVRTVDITVHYKSSHGSQNHINYMSWYSTTTASSAYLVWEFSEKQMQSGTWQSNSRNKTINLNGPKIYICGYSSYCYYAYFTDVWVEVSYPDTSALF